MTKKSILAKSLLACMAVSTAHALPLIINDGSPYGLEDGQVDYLPTSQTLSMQTSTVEPVLLCADLASSTAGTTVDLVNFNGQGNKDNYTAFKGFDSVEYLPGTTTIQIRHQSLECFTIDANNTVAIGPWVPPPEPPVITLNGTDPGPSTGFDVTLGNSVSLALDVISTETPVSWSISLAPTKGTATIDAATGLLQYTAPASSSTIPDTDTLEVTVTDNIQVSDTLTVNINILASDTIFANAFESPLAKNLAPVATKALSTKAANGLLGIDATITASQCTSNGAWDRPGNGQTFCYQITVTNNGTQDLSNVHIRELFPLDSSNLPSNGFSIYGDIDEESSYPFTCTIGANACTGTIDRWATVIPTLTANQSVTLERIRTMHIPQATTDDLVFYAAVFVAGDENTSNNAIRVTVPQNQPPTIADPDQTADGSTTVTMDEDGSPTAFSMAALVATDPENDALTWSIATAAANGNATVDQAGVVDYTPNANYNNDANTPDSFTVQVDDPYLGSASFTVNVVVNPVNDAPTATNSTVSTNEDTTYTFSANDFGFSDVDGDSLAQIRVETLPAAGLLNYNNSSISSLPLVISSTDINLLTFLPAYGANGSNYANFQFSVSDGQVFSQAAATMTIDVIGVNDPPTATSGSITTDEDVPYTAFTVSTFGYSDPDGDSMSALYISAEPVNGQLLLNGNPIGTGTLVSVSDLANLSYVPNQNGNGNAFDSFDFQVNDGNAYSAPGTTITIHVTPVPDAPIAVDSTVTLNEDSTHTFQSTDFGYSDPDADPMAQITITSLPAKGSLLLSGASITVPQIITVANIPNLSYTPVSNENGTGYSSFGFLVNDGTADSTQAATQSLDVTPVNDPPSFTAGGDVTVSAANGAYSGQWATQISAGAPDEDLSQTLTFTVLVSDNTLFTVQPAIDATGVLTFTPNSTAAGTATVTVSLSDGSASTSAVNFSIIIN